MRGGKRVENGEQRAVGGDENAKTTRNDDREERERRTGNRKKERGFGLKSQNDLKGQCDSPREIDCLSIFN
jgi:hypothetical protein